MLLLERFDIDVGLPLDDQGKPKEPVYVPLGEGGEAKTPGVEMRIGTGVMPPGGRGDVVLTMTSKKEWA